MTKWNKNLDILPSNYFPNYVMPELKPFQCNATCWGDIDRAASHTQCLKVILGHSLGMVFTAHTSGKSTYGAKKGIKDACSTVDIFNGWFYLTKYCPHRFPQIASLWFGTFLKIINISAQKSGGYPHGFSLEHCSWIKGLTSSSLTLLSTQDSPIGLPGIQPDALVL